MANKVSKAQAEVIKLMREGYELHKSSSVLLGAHLRNGQFTINLHKSTFKSLRNSELIKVKQDKFPIIIYELTDFGKKIELT